MAGSSVEILYDDGLPVKKIIFNWVSDSATGAASGVTKKLSGKIVRVITDPGTPAPTALYDMTLSDANTDVLQALGANLSATVTADQAVVYSGTSLNPYVHDTLTLAITNAGNSKQGQVVIYLVGA